MRTIITATLLLAITTVQALADGKMFWRESIPPEIPYQRALILFRDGTETLVLQSRYEIPKTGEKTTLGWIVPVPSVPEVASLPADIAHHLFRHLSMNSDPRVTRIAPIAFVILFLVVAGLPMLTLLVCLLSLIVPFPAWFRRNRGRLARASLWGLLCCLLLAVPMIAPIAFVILFLVMAGLSMLTLLVCLLSLIVPFPAWFRRNRGRLARASLWGPLCYFLVAGFISSFTSLHSSRSLGVDVVAELVKTGSCFGSRRLPVVK